MFTGSYKKEDVVFLLQNLVDAPLVTVSEKEALINSGGHYSDVVCVEELPSDKQLEVYHSQLSFMSEELALGVNSLANSIVKDTTAKTIVLISLVRAGTPLGVLLKRAIERQSDKNTYHYGVSIIRDRGIDKEALKYILETHKESDIYFVDGWTGKGTITNSLRSSLASFKGWNRDLKLVVYADPARTAWLSVTKEDLLLPFGILNSTVAGLISRTIYTKTGYHGVYQYTSLSNNDLTYHFIDTVDDIAKDILVYIDLESNYTTQVFNTTIETVMSVSAEVDPNKIKASICETTRSLLRRIPKIVYVSSLDDSDIRLIMTLANERGVPVSVLESIAPYKAISVLK